MKRLCVVCLILFLSLASLAFGEDRILRKNIFLDRWELKGEKGEVLYIDKDFWRSDRYFLKDATNDKTIGEFKHNPWLDRWEYRKGE